MRYIFIILIIFTTSSLFGQIKRWVEPSSIDTTLNLSEKTVKLSPSNPTNFNSNFLSKILIDSLTMGLNNSHRKALRIEAYQIEKYPSKVKREGEKLYIRLNNGNWFHLVRNLEYDEAGHTFEYFFEDFGFYSIRVQWGEGNGYKLINSETGEITYIIGRPFFSPDGQLIISIGNDIEAGYSINGFQLLSNNSGLVTEIGQFSPTSWGCQDAMWLSNSKVILKNESIEYSDSSMNYFNFFTELEIK